MAETEIKTSGRVNPKPGTFINLSNGARAGDYVVVGNYRIKSVGTVWQLHIAAGDGWGKPRKFRSKALAIAAAAEHMLTGSITTQPLSLAQRVAENERCIADLKHEVANLEQRVRGLEARGR